MKILNKKTGEEVSIKENLRIYYKLVLEYKWYFILMILVVSILEFVGVIEKYLFKVLIDNSTGYIGNSLTKDAFIGILVIIASIYIGMVLVKSTSYFFRVRLDNKINGDMILDLKNRFFEHIIFLSHRFHTTHKTGSMISRVNRGTRAIEVINDFFIFNVISFFIQLAIVSAALFYFKPVFALIVLIIATLFIFNGLYTANKQQIPRLNANLAEDIEKGVMADIFTNVDSVKYYANEKFVSNKYGDLALNSKKKSMVLWNIDSYFRSSQSLILSIGTFTLIFLSVLMLLRGELDLGTLTFIYITYGGLTGYLFEFISGFKRFTVGIGDLDSLYQYKQLTNDIKDKPNAKNLKINKGEIQIKNLAFKYHDRNIINDINLIIKPGEKVALVGHSGSGKTTLVKLLYRFYDSNSGEILIDGKNINGFKQESLRRELSIVPQECILFDDTIYNNILFSNPKASKEEVFRAIKFAQLDDFIKILPDKYNTIVGERGVKLSGGEKQRVSIARALLANRKVLVLDEATSSLDSHTEHEIQQDLEKLMKGRTSIIIAHRLSTIMKADKIVVMERGKIVQIGKHRELINQRGVYKELWNLQKGGYIEWDESKKNLHYGNNGSWEDYSC